MKKKKVLVYGTWPDPRSSGMASVQHDIIKELNQQGIEVLLLTQDWDSLQRNPLALQLFQVPADKPFVWEEAVTEPKRFSNLEDLLAKDAQYEHNYGTSLLKDVEIVHTHGDDLIPHYNFIPHLNHFETNLNNYNTLTNYLEIINGKRPKLVRTRHDEIHAAIDRLNRLTGLDWENLPLLDKEKYLADGSAIKPIVKRNISQNYTQLKELYQFEDNYLDHAIDHVYYVLHKLRLWRREAEDFDQIVTLTQNGLDSTITHTLPRKKDENKFTYIHNGTSFGNIDQSKVDDLIYQYAEQGRLQCYRAGKENKEAISFQPQDKKVVFVGRPAIDKGIFELTQSLAKLYAEGHTNLRGIFVGDFNPEIRQKLAAIDPINSEKYLLFTGRISDSDVLASVVSFGNVTAVPSHYDTFALTAAESLFLGKPLVYLMT